MNDEGRAEAVQGERPSAVGIGPQPAELVAEYLPVADGVLCFRHLPPAEVRNQTGIVLVPPFGWEEVASYRARRVWADALAESGHVVIRLDLPGTGDSAGGPGDPGRLESWADAVAAAACRLRAEPGVTRVAALGLGLGGLVGAVAVTRGAPIDDLLLWATPAKGSSAVRRQRALGRLQGSQGLEPGEPVVALAEGWLEVGGFLLSRELLAALEAVDLRSAELGSLQRALVISALAQQTDAELCEHLAGLGLDVTEVSSDEYEAMVDHPGQVNVPRKTMAEVARWLDAGGQPSALDAAPTTTSFELTLEAAGGVTVLETPLWLTRPGGRLFGVLASPSVDAETTPGVCAVLLNAGAVRRSGPNRMWVEAARRWAAEGIPTLRLDLPAIGDSAGDAELLRRTETMYDAAVNADVHAAFDELERRSAGQRFAVGGLCTGGYRAFHAALSDERVSAVALINPRALIWDAELLPRRDAKKFRAGNLLSPAQWKRLVRGELPLSTVRQSFAARLRLLQQSRRAPEAAVPAEQSMLETALDDLGRAHVTVLVGFSGNEPLRDELELEGLLDAVERWPALEVIALPGRDHELRPLAAQRATHLVLDQAVDAAVRDDARAYSSS